MKKFIINQAVVGIIIIILFAIVVGVVNNSNTEGVDRFITIFVAVAALAGAIGIIAFVIGVFSTYTHTYIAIMTASFAVCAAIAAITSSYHITTANISVGATTFPASSFLALVFALTATGIGIFTVSIVSRRLSLLKPLIFVAMFIEATVIFGSIMAITNSWTL